MSVDWEAALREIEPSEGAKKTAKNLNFFGIQPKAETIEKIRRPVGIGAKGFTQGALGQLGNLAEILGPLAGPLGQFFPSSKQVGKDFESVAGEKFTPETTTEEFIERGAEGAGSILGTGGPLKAATGIGQVAKTTAAALVPAGVSLFTEKENLPPWMQAAATIGSSLALHRASGKSLRSIEKDLYGQARNLAAGQNVDASQLSRNLNTLEQQLSKGGSTGPKSAVKGLVDEIKAKIANGRISMEDLMEFKRNINERAGEFFKISGSKGFWKLLGKNVDNAIQVFEQTNPQFKDAYRYANSLHKGLNESRVIERFIKSHPILAGHAGGINALLHFSGIGAPGIGTAALAKGAEVATALVRNPGLRRAYFDFLKSASKGEVRGALAALKKFNSNDEIKKAVNSDEEWQSALQDLK